MVRIEYVKHKRLRSSKTTYVHVLSLYFDKFHVVKPR